MAKKKNEDYLDSSIKKRSIDNPAGGVQKFEVNGHVLHGTWEYNIALKLIEHDIDWHRAEPVSYVKENGKKSYYTPDFYLPEFGVHLEVKGYWWPKDILKMNLVKQQNPHLRIVYVEEKDYKEIMKK